MLKNTEIKASDSQCLHLSWVYQAELPGNPANPLETHTTYTYDVALAGLGQLAEEHILGSYPDVTPGVPVDIDQRHQYQYDALGRVQQRTVFIDGAQVGHPEISVYDALGRVQRAADASGRWLKHEYGATGAVRALCESSAGDASSNCPESGSSTYLRTLSYDAWGNVDEELRGGVTSFRVVRAYEQGTGLLTLQCSGIDIPRGVEGPDPSDCRYQSDSYEWDPLGNLEKRIRSAYTERFEYDDLNRLVHGELTELHGQYTIPLSMPSTTESLSYDGLGNICERMIEGNMRAYSYGPGSGCHLINPNSTQLPSGSPHAVGQVGSVQYLYDALGNQTQAIDGNGGKLDRDIEYTAASQAWRIWNDETESRFWYGLGGQRYRHQKIDSTGTETTVYLGSVELITRPNGDQVYRRYVGGVVVQEIEAVPNGTTTKSEQMLHDHIGSVAVLVDQTTGYFQSMDFGAFGQRRTFVQESTSLYGLVIPTSTDRGFTGHQMLDGLNVIHMNGRIYDSRIARFLQPDPVVQEPKNAQNWNRYTYVWNNPLNATDPTGMIGEKMRMLIAIGISVFTGGIAYAGWFGITMTTAAVNSLVVVSGMLSGFIQSGNLTGLVTGALGSAMFTAIPGWLGDAATAGWQGVAAHGMTGGVLSVLQGGKFGHGFASAGLTKAFTPAISKIQNKGARVMTAAIVGGTISEATGGKFANGAVTAAMGYAFNHEQHRSEWRSIELENGELFWYETRGPNGYGTIVSDHVSAIAGTEAGQELLSRLQESEHSVRFLYRRGGPSAAKFGDLTEIRFDPNFDVSVRTTVGELVENPIYVLAHELHHAYVNAHACPHGYCDKSLYHSEGSKARRLDNKEAWAVRHTNMIRDQNNAGYRRTHYGNLYVN